MNWFRRHPNWTVIIWLPIIYGTMVLIVADNPNGGGAEAVIGGMVAIVLLFGWNLWVKQRSLWWLLLLPLSFLGIIIILSLGRQEQPESSPAFDHSTSGKPPAKQHTLPKGAPLRFCFHCGTQLVSGAGNYCPSCGNALAGGKPAATTTRARRKSDPEKQKEEVVSMIEDFLGREGGEG